MCDTGKRSKLWATFNEPGVFAMCSYIAANHPPGMLMQFKVRQICHYRPLHLIFAFCVALCSLSVFGVRLSVTSASSLRLSLLHHPT